MSGRRRETQAFLPLTVLLLACASTAPATPHPKAPPPAPVVAVAAKAAPSMTERWGKILALCEQENKVPCDDEAGAAEKDGKRKSCAQNSLTPCEIKVREAVAAFPTETAFRERCGRYLRGKMFFASAADVLDGVPSSDKEAVRLLLVSAELRLKLAKEGPNQGHKDPQADERWVNAQIERIIAAMNRALGISPGNGEVVALLARAYEERKQPARALQVMDDAKGAVDSNPALGIQRARLLAALGRDKEAIAAYRAALDRDEFSAESWREIGKLYTKVGDKDAAKQAEARAVFHQFLLPGTRLPYSAERAKTARALAGYFQGEPGPAKASLASLERANSEESAVFLASFAHLHSDDAVEERAYRALVRLGPEAGPVLIQLFKNAESTCTIRRSLDALSRIRPLPEQAAKLALQALAGDRDPFFPTEAGRAVARIADPKSVAPLLTIAGCGPLVEHESRADYPAFVRGESLIALAMIDGAAARTCLEKLAPNKKTEFHVKAAACVATGEDKPCQTLVDYGRNQCAGMGFPAFIVPKYIDDWAGDRRDRKKWPKALSAALRACEKANKKSK